MPNKTKENIQQEETLSSDVMAFCALVARILMRCLRENDPRIMELLSLTPKSEGGTPDAT